MGTYAITSTTVGETSAARSFVVNAPLYLNLFITATGVDTTVNQTTPTAAGALTSADAICNSDANKPAASLSIGSMTYKAVLWSTGLRTTTNLATWPMKANTTYQTTQNGSSPKIVGTTNSYAAIWTQTNGIIGTVSGNNAGFLSGLKPVSGTQSWADDSNCSNWTTTYSANTNGALYGWGAALGSWPEYWIGYSRDYCTASKTTWHLLCAEQPA